ncbi:MAG: hypothetical protein AAF658_08345, partial [Myxococcota bacterium]
MRTILPSAFNQAMPNTPVLSSAELDGVVPALVEDLVRVDKPAVLEVQRYLEKRAGDLLDRSKDAPIIKRAAEQLAEAAAATKLDASLFEAFLELA